MPKAQQLLRSDPRPAPARSADRARPTAARGARAEAGVRRGRARRPLRESSAHRQDRRGLPAASPRPPTAGWESPQAGLGGMVRTRSRSAIRCRRCSAR
jgi:hypothetical protein